jgi:hypothetical protein
VPKTKINARNFLLALLLFSASNHLIAQEKDKPQGKSFITLNIMSPIFSYANRYNLGFYHQLTDHFIAGLEVGYGSTPISIGMGRVGEHITKAYKIYEFKPELMFVLNPKNTTRKFLSIDTYYIYHTDKFDNEFEYNSFYHDTRSDKYYSYDSANYTRRKYGLNLNFGMICSFSKHLGLIWKAGVGIRKRNVEYSNIVNPEEIQNRDNELHYSTYLKNTGYSTNFSPALDVKLYYRF